MFGRSKLIVNKCLGLVNKCSGNETLVNKCLDVSDKMFGVSDEICWVVFVLKMTISKHQNMLSLTPFFSTNVHTFSDKRLVPKTFVY